MSPELRADNDLITTAETAKLLGVRVETLSNWRNLGRGPKYLRIARKIYYRAAEIREFIESSIVDPAARKAAVR